MTVTPIYDSLMLVRHAIVPTLQSRTSAGVYWTMAPEGVAMPLVVVQSQDGGGLGLAFLSSILWQGEVTVKAMAALLATAEATLADVAPGMDVVPPPVGYSLIARYLRAVTLPPNAGVYQVGHTWMVTLGRP